MSADQHAAVRVLVGTEGSECGPPPLRHSEPVHPVPNLGSGPGADVAPTDRHRHPGTVPGMESVTEVIAAHAGAELERRVDAGEPGWIAAESRWLTPALAERLYADRDGWHLGTLAENPATPPHVLEAMTRDTDAALVYKATHNPSTPIDAVVAVNPDLALWHPACPVPALLDALPRPAERALALQHPNLPLDVLARAVRGRAWPTHPENLLRNPNLTHRQARRILRTVLPREAAQPWWARHPNADPAWLSRHVAALGRFVGSVDHDHDHSDLLRAVAGNPSTPPADLERIAGWGYPDYVLPNPACPASVMRAEVTRSPRGSEATKVARHPRTPRSVLALIPGSVLSVAETRYSFTLVHAATPNEARALLTLGAAWNGTLLELLDTAATVTAA